MTITQGHGHARDPFFCDTCCPLQTGRHRDEGSLAYRLMIQGPSNSLVTRYFWRLIDYAAECGFDMDDVSCPVYFRRGQEHLMS